MGTAARLSALGAKGQQNLRTLFTRRRRCAGRRSIHHFEKNTAAFWSVSDQSDWTLHEETTGSCKPCFFVFIFLSGCCVSSQKFAHSFPVWNGTHTHLPKQELAEAIDGMASIGEANLLRITGGLVPALPGMNGPINTRRMDEISMMLETFRDAIVLPREAATNNNSTTTTNNSTNNVNNSGSGENGSNDITNSNNSPLELARMETIVEMMRVVSSLVRETRQRPDFAELQLLEELQSVIRMVAVEILEIRGSRAVRTVLRRGPS